jgi:hypothetical protein
MKPTGWALSGSRTVIAMYRAVQGARGAWAAMGPRT